MPVPTKAMQSASIEALKCTIQDQQATIDALKRDLNDALFNSRNLEAMVTSYRRGEIAATQVRSTANTMLRARDLAKLGTACYVRSGRVFNAKTHELIP